MSPPAGGPAAAWRDTEAIARRVNEEALLSMAQYPGRIGLGSEVRLEQEQDRCGQQLVVSPCVWSYLSSWQWQSAESRLCHFWPSVAFHPMREPSAILGKHCCSPRSLNHGGFWPVCQRWGTSTLTATAHPDRCNPRQGSKEYDCVT